jgi:hypothetical protein
MEYPPTDPYWTVTYDVLISKEVARNTKEKVMEILKGIVTAYGPRVRDTKLTESQIRSIIATAIEQHA